MNVALLCCLATFTGDRAERTRHSCNVEIEECSSELGKKKKEELADCKKSEREALKAEEKKLKEKLKELKKALTQQSNLKRRRRDMEDI